MIKIELMNILEIIKGSLYSMQFPDQEQDELTILFHNWLDASYLYDFFYNNRLDLFGPFFKHESIEKAVEETIEEAQNLFDKLIIMAKFGKNDPYNKLQKMFQPLSDSDYKLRVYQKSKVKGNKKRSWLRLYAIRIEANTFVITGGAIKLTKTMNERNHTNKELQKLTVARDYLRKMEILFKEDFLILEH